MDTSQQTPFWERLHADLAAWGQALDNPRLDTLYLGGGTPSLMALEALQALTQRIQHAFKTETLTEASLEGNPDSVTLAWLQGARKLGWDRFSLGIQSLDPELLTRLGRPHSAAAGRQALDWARQAGFTRISADLLMGAPGQKHTEILEDVRSLMDAGVEHLSIYMLDLDKDCPLAHAVAAGQLSLPGENEIADAYETLHEELPKLGFYAYEISSYARPGGESQHNARYWERRPYLGLGPGAASQLARWRWSEADSLRAWLHGQDLAECQLLSQEEAWAEIPLLGLRMDRGIDWDALRAQGEALGLRERFQQWETALRPKLHAGLVEQQGPILRLTPKGKLLSNPILALFL